MVVLVWAPLQDLLEGQSIENSRRLPLHVQEHGADEVLEQVFIFCGTPADEAKTLLAGRPHLPCMLKNVMFYFCVIP